MQDMFNTLMNRISKEQGPLEPGTAALYHFPEIFLKRKDDYIISLIRKIIEDSDSQNFPIKNIDVYLGNIHVSPISRLWNTSTMLSVGGDDNTDTIKQEKSKKLSLDNFKDFKDFHKMKVDFEELAEEKIEKQAMMEAIFNTQYWSEPYIQNQFIYVTDHNSDYEGEKG